MATGTSSLTEVKGTVYDTDGNTVAGAKVTVTRSETGKTLTTATSGSSGSFTVLYSPGSVTMTASKSGYTDLKIVQTSKSTTPPF